MNLTGYIYGDNNKPVAATLTVSDPLGGIQATMEVPPGQQYFVNFDAEDLRQFSFKFSSPGYQSQTVTGAELLDTGSNIHLQKINPLLIIGIAAGLAYAFSKSKKKGVGKITTDQVTPVILIVGAFLGINAISKLLDKLGLGGNPAANDLTDPNSPWGPNYYKQFSTYTYAISLDQADTMASTIHNAFTVINDDFSAILGVFNQLRTKSNVSFLSDIFTRKYGENLLSFLTDGGGVMPWDGLSKEHLSQLLTYVQKLPQR